MLLVYLLAVKVVFELRKVEYELIKLLNESNILYLIQVNLVEVDLVYDVVAVVLVVKLHYLYVLLLVDLLNDSVMSFGENDHFFLFNNYLYVVVG